MSYQNDVFIVNSIDDVPKIITANPETFVFRSEYTVMRAYIGMLLIGDFEDQEEQDKDTEETYGKNILEAAKLVRLRYNVATPDWMTKQEIEFTKV